jgi:hypothetical protein
MNPPAKNTTTPENYRKEEIDLARRDERWQYENGRNRLRRG